MTDVDTSQSEPAESLERSSLFLRFAGFLLRSIVRGGVDIYYSRITISHRDRIPAKGPVLVASNHPNSLFDPVIIGLSVKRPVHFFAKAPLFEIPVFGPLIRALGMVPAFRGSDDRSQAQVKRNLASLSEGARHLKMGEAVGIFPEGKSHDLPKLEMVRSGVARMAIQAYREGAEDLKIVPLGLNYERKETFRSAVWIQVGDPISVHDWLADHKDDDHRAMRELTTELDRRLKELAIHLDNEKWEPFLYDLETLLPARASQYSDPIASLRLRKRIADAMNYFQSEDRSRADSVASSIQDFRAKLKAVGLSMRTEAICRKGPKLILRYIWEIFWVIFWLPLAVLGTSYHMIPFILVRLIAPRLQVPGRTTIATARLGLGVPIYGVWYGAFAWLMSQYFLPWVVWTWTLGAPLTGLLALYYWPRCINYLKGLWRQLLLWLHPRKLSALRAERRKLCERVAQLSTEYGKLHPVASVGGKRVGMFRKLVRVLAAAAAVVALLVTYFALRGRAIPELAAGSQLAALPPAALASQLDADEKALGDILNSLPDLESKSIQLRDEFRSGKRSYYKQADNDQVRRLLLPFVNYRTALLRIIGRNESYQSLLGTRERLRACLLANAAASKLYETSLKFTTEFGTTPAAVQKLNEGEPLWQIPPGLYDHIKRNLMDGRHHARLNASLQQYDSLQDEFAAQDLLRTFPHGTFHSAIQQARVAIPRLEAKLGGGILTAAAGEADDLRKIGVYKTKTFVSTWIGDLRIRAPRGHRGLISSNQVDELHAKLRPGDILIERHNWNLSNAFLPGYWPHAALYVGSPDDLRRLAIHTHPDVQRRLEEFSKLDLEGHQFCIIESLSEGVIFNSLEHSVGTSDSVAVFRPRIDEKSIREAICRAFSHSGKPYDFEFDFFSTDKIVCTELVFRSYDGVIDFPLVDILGTKTLPAIEIVRKYTLEKGTPSSQLDFVAFLDGDERTGKVRLRNEAALGKTLDRSALTWLQAADAE